MSKLISFPTAKLAKEKGFDVPIQHTVNNVSQLYDMNNGKINIQSNVVDNWNKFDTVCSAPTQMELADWLLEEHNIDVIVLPVFRDGKCGYDSFLRTGWRYVVTKGNCIHGDHMTFNQHIEFELRESNSVEESEEDKETMEEFLYRNGIYIGDDKKEVFEKGLIEALNMI